MAQQQTTVSPLKQLAYLIKVYAAHYGVDGYEAVKLIRRDAQGFVTAGKSMRFND